MKTLKTYNNYKPIKDINSESYKLRITTTIYLGNYIFRQVETLKTYNNSKLIKFIDLESYRLRITTIYLRKLYT